MCVDYISIMKIIFSAIVALFLFSCAPDVCNTSTYWNAKVNFYTLSSKSADSIISIDTIDVWGVGTGLLHDTALKATGVSIPLQISYDTTRFVFARKAVNDTLTMVHSNEPVYISKACGYGTKQTLEKVFVTKHSVKSVTLKNTSIEKNASENIKLYY